MFEQYVGVEASSSSLSHRSDADGVVARAIASILTYRIKIMRPAAALLILALGGCATGNLSKNEPQSVAVAPLTAPTPAAPSLSSPAARAAAAPDATVSSSGKLPCETQSCKINCAPKVAPRFRPKWCAQFEEPVE